MARVVAGPVSMSLRLFRSLFLGFGGVALAGGLALGVATAAPEDPPSDPPAAVSPPAAPAGRPVVRPLQALRQQPRRPLHALIAARLRRDQPAQEATKNTTIAGSVVQIDVSSSTALVLTAQGQVRRVRVTPQTHFGGGRPRRGDRVLVVGRRTADGALVAQSVFVRAGASPSGA